MAEQMPSRPDERLSEPAGPAEALGTISLKRQETAPTISLLL